MAAAVSAAAALDVTAVSLAILLPITTVFVVVSCDAAVAVNLAVSYTTSAIGNASSAVNLAVSDTTSAIGNA